MPLPAIHDLHLQLNVISLDHYQQSMQQYMIVGVVRGVKDLQNMRFAIVLTLLLCSRS